MPIQTVNIDKVDQQLAELLSIAREKGEIQIVQNGEPLGLLESVAPPEKKKKRVAGLHEGNIIFMAEDFDAPLPDEFWLGEDS
ncbi:MAG: toxin-antitoxin (TA) system antitoxin [Chloracidobacterium sp.]|nr:toxin-antitoxin (TA) system antitoxin [Chloracidobacterium sp.]